MNRIASRATAAAVLVLVLLGGLGFFLTEYFHKAQDWVMFTGSPHIYTNGRLGSGVITDRSGILLADLREGRSYSTDETLRKAVLHWVGDRQGNVSVPYMDRYTEALLAYDPVAGLYQYGENAGIITLTLSANLQKAALEAMGDRVGTLAVYNYRTGELLCAVSTPTFDPDHVPDIAGDTTGAYTGVYVNRFLHSAYTPGSIFKIVTLAAVLESAQELMDARFTCQGTYQMSGGKVSCTGTHGSQNLQEAFRNSCNCAFAQITEGLGREKLQAFVEKTGLTESLSFDGFVTHGGNFDTEGASAQQLAWSGIGQHKDLVNPCGFLTFLGAIAGDGRAVQPYCVAQVSSGDKITYTAEKQTGKALFSKETCKILREYMGLNVTEKYGAEHFPGLTVCAKSGTAEVGGGKAPTAMFAGFVSDTQYPLAFVVTVEEGGFGAQTCVPILAKVLEACKTELFG